MTPTTAPHIRWVIRRDDRRILAIDDCGYVEPWSQADLLQTLKDRASSASSQRTNAGESSDFASTAWNATRCGFFAWQSNHANVATVWRQR